MGLNLINFKTKKMSTSLYWSKIPEPPKDNNIGSLKWTLAKKLWDSDGSLGESPTTIGKEWIPFLEGIIEGNGSGDMARDAKKLIEALQMNGKVNVTIY